MSGDCVTLAELESGGVDGAVLLTEHTSVKKAMLQIILHSKQHLFETSYTPVAHYIAVKSVRSGADLCPSSAFTATNNLREQQQQHRGGCRGQSTMRSTVSSDPMSIDETGEEDTKQKQKGEAMQMPQQSFFLLP